jgi:cytochrome c oxidase subunit IV
MSDKAEKTDKKYIFDNPRNVQRLLNGFYVICILLVAADFIIHRHISMAWEKIPAFYAVYGFVACVLLVILAKLMRKVVMRKETYYDE